MPPHQLIKLGRNVSLHCSFHSLCKYTTMWNAMMVWQHLGVVFFTQFIYNKTLLKSFSIDSYITQRPNLNALGMFRYLHVPFFCMICFDWFSGRDYAFSQLQLIESMETSNLTSSQNNSLVVNLNALQPRHLTQSWHNHAKIFNFMI